MIKPDWNSFKAKFTTNPQYHFEWFCYLLFCKEVNRPYGVFRYKNQSAIETTPVEHDGHQLGFQSKFYDTTLSSNKAEILEMLDKAKRDYPELTKLYLYTNQEWSQHFPKTKTPAQKTKAQKAIEKKATSLGIELEWRTMSYFDSSFVCQDCADISQYFFVKDNNLLHLIKKQERHTESIFKNIKEEISFSGHQFSIERASVLESLINNKSQVSIVCGKGGVGKTVELKKFYHTSKNSNPIFAFKATELELNRLDDLIKDSSTEDFLSLFGDSRDKIIIIDSGEKLMDLNNQEPIKEFIDLSINFGWRIIFTTRDHYFDDLNFLCLDVLDIKPNKIYISALTDNELDSLSCQYKFDVPNDQRLQVLLQVPFYLNEYLKFYGDNAEQPFDYKSFKENLWHKKIKQNNITREQVFSELALQRANEGKFYLSVKGFSHDAIESLIKDEILGSDETSYFISHDIYEEWALEKFIDIAYKNKLSTKEFFIDIGQSLPIRRSFRHWLSEQLFFNTSKIKIFIEKSINDNSIASIWKDELIVAILLSDYSSSFFESFESELLQENLELLQRICFILRIGCKESDNSVFSLLGLKVNSELPYSLFFTKPKGAGWSSLIDFIYSHMEQLGQENLNMFIPVFYEWNSSVKQGDTTRKASLLCLEHYKWLEYRESYIRNGKRIDSIVKTISYGANEIKEELGSLIDEMCKSSRSSRKVPFSNLARLILRDLDGVFIAKSLPEKTLQLAKSLWLKEYDHVQERGSLRKKEHILFGITDNYDFKYHPDSALQTPILSLLRFDLNETVDFILSFTNQITLNLVNNYANDEFQTHDLIIGDTTNKVYLDTQLWGEYRGAGDAPYLVKSVLMALEQFFLENAEHFKGDELEDWLKYMLSKTNSSAICSVVSSIVLANREKLFNVAEILFRVKEFIQYDTARLVFDRQHKRQLEMLGGMLGGMPHGKKYHNERLKACDAKHRTDCLEHLFRNYQFFASKEVADDSAFHDRQTRLWNLLDIYYEEVEAQEDSENLNIWRLALARMDCRKMDITTEDVGDKIVINFNPELTPDLQEISESNLVQQEKNFKYLPLSEWASNKLEQNDDFKKYPQYESNPKKVVSDLKDLIAKLLDKSNPPTEQFFDLNHSTPIQTAVALIKYHSESLEKDDSILCSELVINNLKNILSDKYQYQVDDGINFCFDVIHNLFEAQAELRPVLKQVLLAGLFRTDSIDMMGGNHFYILSINAINKLWNKFEEDAESLLKGFLLLKPRYEELIDQIRQQSFERKELNVNFDDLWQNFYEENSDVFEELFTNEWKKPHTVDYSSLDMNTKAVTLHLLQANQNKLCKDIFVGLVNASVEDIFSDDQDNSGDYQSKNEFLETYAYYVLKSPLDELPELLKPFVDNFNSVEGASDLLEQIIYAQDHLDKYDNFWKIWELFKPRVILLSQADYLNHRFDKIIKAYLFAVHWKPEAKHWHTFQDRNARFFNDMAEKLSRSPATLYSLSKLLDGIGSDYLPQGVHWIAKILKANDKLTERDLEDGTVHYINSYIRKYLYRERAEVRKSPELMSETLIVLNFLIEQGEVSGYLLRESIV